MKIGLYTITYLGIWYDGPALTLKQSIDRAKSCGFDGIEFEGKRPHACPLDLDRRDRAEIRSYLEKRDMPLVAIAANNDFSSNIVELQEAQLLFVRELIRLASDLGAPILRVYCAWSGYTMREGLATYDMARQHFDRDYPDMTRLERWNAAKDCLKEVAGYAEEAGVILALQNHSPLIRHWRDTLNMAIEVNSPYLKMCLDAPLLVHQDDEYVREAVLAVADLQVHSHFGGEWARTPDGGLEVKPSTFGAAPVNYPAFVSALREIGYDGYLNFEFCHPALNDRHEPVGIDFVDEQTQFALQYMRGALEQTA